MRQRSMTSKMTWIRPPTPGLLVILEAEVARWSRRGHFEFQYDPTAFRLKRLPIARMFGSLAFARTQSTKPRIRTMSFSMSQASLPVFDIGLNALSSILDKAEAHAAAKNMIPQCFSIRVCLLKNEQMRKCWARYRKKTRAS